MNKATIILVLMLGFAAATSVAASEIYKWTDEDGNTQYGDRPAEGAERLTAIESRQTNNGHVRALTQARLDRKATAAEKAVAAAAEEQSEEELRAEAQERAGQCKTYRGRLESLITSRRMYREDENGERVYLADDEMVAARAKVQSQVEEYCSS